MKHCKKCGKSFNENGFYKGHSKCKECVKARVRQHRRENESVRQYDRLRAKYPHRREGSKRISKRWREENPLAYKAQNALNNALRDGKIKRDPCAICGVQEQVHAHHRDYSRPLDVVWLCAKCHHRIHKLFPELEGTNKQEASTV